MSSLVDDISLDLRKNYKVDEYFYPKISMDLDIPNGVKGEINDIIKVLQKNGFKVSSENVFRIMELKKIFLTRYSEQIEGKTEAEKYRRILLEDIKPVGIAEPIELILVNGLIVVALYMIARFVGSFADEAGKIMARKLLENDKERSKDMNLNVKEYRFLKNEVEIFIQDGKMLDSLKRKLKKK